MLKEALQFLDALSQRAAKPFHYHPPEEPASVYILDGVRTVAAPELRKHQAENLATVCAWAKEAKDSSIWYRRDGITCYLDDNTRRDIVRMPLKPSPQIAMIQNCMPKSSPIKQAGLILMLRTLFRDNLVQCPKLIEILRSIRFKVGADTTSTVQRPGKASIGKTIESEVTGIDAIPEEFLLNIPVFESAEFRNFEGLLPIALEMDAGTETFTLHPIPGAVEAAFYGAECRLANDLRDEMGKDYSKIYFGVP